MVKHIAKIVLGEELYNIKDTEVRGDLNNHASNTDIHVTAAEKEYWNSKVNPPSYSAPTAKQLTYTGEAQDLLNPGSSTSGSIQYSTDEVNWSTTIPQATNAGTYTVYWKFAGSEIVYVDSTAINVTIAKATPTYTAPTAKTLIYNGNAQDLLNAGTSNDGTISYSNDNENWGSSIPQGTNAGSYTVYWKLTGDANHNDVASTSINVSIAKVTPTVTAPTAKSGLTYTGSAQELVNAGSTDFGTLQYSLDNETYGTSIPSGTNAGDYSVYYKVVGDSNVNDVAAQSVSCSIGKGNRSVSISGNSTTLELGTTNTITVTTEGSPTTTVSSSNTGVAAVSGMTITAAGKGTTTITIIVAGDSNYNEYTYSYTLTVEQKHMGHEYVDLGLPSGTKWAKYNVGATSESEYGNFYQYGKGANQYAVTSGQSDYVGFEDPLSLSVDTARQTWGGDWHMPTKAQFEELTANTTYIWTTVNGTNGGLFASNINGNFIFIPGAGSWRSGSRRDEDSRGHVWSSSPDGSYAAFSLYFFGGGKGVGSGRREYGFSVRPVFG